MAIGLGLGLLLQREHEGAQQLLRLVGEARKRGARLGGQGLRGRRLGDGAGLVVVARGGEAHEGGEHLVHHELIVRVVVVGTRQARLEVYLPVA